MDISQLLSTSMSGSSGVQGASGHHHRHKSISEQISDMEKAIGDAAKSGQLTSDQASSMTKELDDIKQKLGLNGSGTQTGATQLSADDKKQIRKELHDVGKQLFQALNPQASASSTSSSSKIDDLFNALDANGDGKIDKNELSSAFNSLNTNGYNAGNQNNNTGGVYSQQMSFSFTQVTSTFSVTA